MSLCILYLYLYIYSRKRGPVKGTGYITIFDEAVMKAFLVKYPNNTPFIDGKCVYILCITICILHA